MSEEQQRKSGCTWLQLIVAFGVIALLAFGAMPGGHRVQVKALQSSTAGNCRQIVAALRLYAGDHNGKYPDAHESEPTTSNDAFRILISEGILEDERVFGAKLSKFIPDNNIGEAPDFKDALEAGENHWAMTKAVTTKSPPLTPLVFENPVASGWPPIWNADAAGKNEKGRAWKGGKIIVCFNDTSALVIKT
jgi:type II secretory pathway pseudopilin PulG